METNQKQPVKSQYLDFIGTNIPFTRVDGKFWIPIRPLCDALGVNYDRQYKNLKVHPILSRVYAKQHTHDATNRLQEMICLPEKFIYGWIFGLSSTSEILLEYQMRCYEVLFDHFHGTLTRRNELLLEKAELLEAIEQSRAELVADERYITIGESQKQIKRLNASLKAHDTAVMNGQSDLFPLAQ